MKNIGLIFPHQLFKNNPILEHVTKVYLIEDSLFFGDKHTQLTFHKQKLVFHRASMQYYYQYLLGQGVDVEYVPYQKDQTINTIAPDLVGGEIVCIDPTDCLLERRLRRRFGETLTLLDTPLFINTKTENKNWVDQHEKYFMHNFYKNQRRKLNILMDKDGNPTGGRWSYDDENRKKIPQREIPHIPAEPKPNTDEYVLEAKKYVIENFKKNYGQIDSFWYPVTHSDAELWLDHFLNIRFDNFGAYEDAMVSGNSILYHSVLSPLINVGLLEPLYVVERALTHAKQHNTALNNVEGFIRQIIGWREYIRMLYEHEGVTMRNNNHWNHKRALPTSYWTGNTNIEPIDESIQQILKTGYTHHIERLMLHGNFMFLNETKPNDTYKWFMEMFIDSYDWVMVPNVYGMTQNTSHGLMTTKPYISGSNYVLKMSNYKKGTWSKIWNALYWSFIIKHIDYLTKNGRMFFVTNRAAKFTDEQKNTYEKTKEDYYSSQNRIQDLPDI